MSLGSRHSAHQIKAQANITTKTEPLGHGDKSGTVSEIILVGNCCKKSISQILKVFYCKSKPLMSLFKLLIDWHFFW